MGRVYRGMSVLKNNNSNDFKKVTWKYTNLLNTHTHLWGGGRKRKGESLPQFRITRLLLDTRLTNKNPVQDMSYYFRNNLPVSSCRPPKFHAIVIIVGNPQNLTLIPY